MSNSLHASKDTMHHDQFTIQYETPIFNRQVMYVSHGKCKPHVENQTRTHKATHSNNGTTQQTKVRYIFKTVMCIQMHLSNPESKKIRCH